MWKTGTVLKGSQDGRKIGFPTVNLSPTLIPSSTKQGVYGSQVKYKDKIYLGALYFGPRLVKHETFTILEIHIIDFDEDLYGETIEFTVERFIREPIDIKSFEELKEQLHKDIASIR